MRLAPLLAIFSILPIAAPAAGQIAGRPVYDPVPRMDRLGRVDSALPAPRPRNELRDLRGRIDDARESGRISRGEARAYRREARVIGALARRYGRDGLSPSEVTELRVRAQVLGSALTRSTPSGR
ncbi:MAG TPA: hypothetical protein VGO55_09885 [Allosphingosinicella sp.]|jgi:hypothetical protein|nr:hypothetical protein [Allosphingosinicella sp.]